MSNLNRFFLLSILSMFFISCGFVNIMPVSLECSVSNEDDFYNEDTISLSFNYDVNPDLTEKIITLKKDGKSIDLEYVWNSNSCTLRPKAEWSLGSKYQLIINGTLYTVKDGHFSIYINRNFYYGKENEWLRLSACSIEENQIISGKDAVVYTFNKPVNEYSFISNFSINPHINYETKFENNVVSIIPVDKWSVNTIYTWELSSLLASDGYILDKDYSSYFCSEEDTELPVVTDIKGVNLIDNEYVWDTEDLKSIDLNQYIGIKFSKPMDETSISDCISISPTIKGNVITILDSENESFIFIPSTKFAIGTDYRLTIDTNAKSLNELPLYTDKIIDFKISNDYLKIDSIEIESSEAGTENVVLYTYGEENTIKSFVFSGSTTDLVNVDISFSTAIDKSLQKDMLNYITLSTLFPLSVDSPTLCSARWNSNNTKLILGYKKITKADTNAPNYYQIKFTGGNKGCKNINGEYLEEDLCVTFITQ